MEWSKEESIKNQKVVSNDLDLETQLTFLISRLLNILTNMISLAQIVKYLLEGLAVAVAAYFIPQRKSDVIEIVAIGISAAATFMLLDQLAPSVASGARQGAGFGIGLNQVGWQGGGAEEDTEDEE